MFALKYSSSDDLSDNNITVSSAKQIILAFSTKSNKLLINIIKNNGSRIVPYDTPWLGH